MGIYKTIKENDIYISMHRSSSKDAYLYFDLSEAITHSEKILRGILETVPAAKCILRINPMSPLEAFALFLFCITLSPTLK